MADLETVIAFARLVPRTVSGADNSYHREAAKHFQKLKLESLVEDLGLELDWSSEKILEAASTLMVSEFGAEQFEQLFVNWGVDARVAIPRLWRRHGCWTLRS
jgi:hypothetical protein